MKRIFGFTCLIWAVIFGHLETNYFGNNFFPQTNEEIICDLTALLFCMAGGVLLFSTKKESINTNSLPKEIYLVYDKKDGEVFCAFVDKEECKKEAEESGCGMQTVRLIGKN